MDPGPHDIPGPERARASFAGVNAPLHPEQFGMRERGLDVEEEQKRYMEQAAQRMQLDNNGKRNVPAYNNHEQRGMPGLTDPALLGQGTPLPHERQYSQQKNLQAIMNSLPPQMAAANQQIVKSVESAMPEVYRRITQPTSIYQSYSKDFMVNRINLATMRRRQNSIYGIV